MVNEALYPNGALSNRLDIFQRAHLIDKMANAHQRGGDVAGWLPLLSQTQVAIEAVEAAMKESLAPG